jgi:nucleotide-binding universal stress UspA family protein
MIKDLVVKLGSESDFAADYAASVAQAFGAHLGAVAFVYEPVIPGALLGGVPTELIEVQREENSKAARDAVARFEAATAGRGLSTETRILDASIAGAADLFARIARRYDLAVVGQALPEEGAAQELLIEGALFESGRPVIIVPYIQKAPLKLDRVLVCWDASKPATRAIADAIPFLQRAGRVDIVVIAGEGGKAGELAGVRMATHLARHGVTVEIKRIPAGGTEVQTAIQAHLADTGADFLVMGGYGHSRLREFILGGVTRTILKSMTVPVLMSH